MATASLMAPTQAKADISRLAKIRKRAEPRIRRRFRQAGVGYPAGQMLLRALKQERAFELWAASGSGEELSLVHSYPICAVSGQLGPKRRWGDEQVPEGTYQIHRFNAWSGFHMSLRVNYPNLSDRIRGRAGALGGAIMVHGGCATIGCIPILNGPVEEVFVAVLDAHRKMRHRVPIHIFPAALTPDGLTALKREANPSADAFRLWAELAPIYQAFEATRRIPSITIDARTGAYRLGPRGAA